jgi:hypothetical protein
MRTHTTRTLLTLVAVAALGPACWGHEDATPAGTYKGTPVRDGKYVVCSTDNYSKDSKSHLSVGDVIEIKVNKDAPVSSVRFTMFNPPRASARDEASQKAMAQLPASQSKSELVPMLTCCGGERLGGVMTFLHYEQRQSHFVYIENTAPAQKPTDCKRESVVTIRFCYPGRDAKGAEGWTCDASPNTHGGDVHAEL